MERRRRKTILGSILNITPVDGSIIPDEDDEPIGKCGQVSNKDHEFNYSKAVEDLDLSNVKVGLVYDFWLNEDGEIIGIWETEDKDLTKVEFTEISKVKFTGAGTALSPYVLEKVTLKVNGEDKEYKVTDGFTYSVNEEDSTDLHQDLVADSTVFGIAYLDGSKLASIYGEQYSTYAIVDEVKAKEIIFDTNVKTVFDEEDRIKLDADKIDYFFTKDGKSIKVTDLEEGDVVALYAVKNGATYKKYVGKVLTDKVEGKVSAVSSSKFTAKVGGTSYKLADNTDNDLYEAIEGELKSEIVAYIDAAGKIAMFKVVDKAAGNVAIVKSIKTYTEKGDSVVDVVLYYSDETVSDTLRLDIDETFDELYKDAKFVATADNKITTAMKINGQNPDEDVVSGTYYKVDDGEYVSSKTNFVINKVMATYKPGYPCCYEVSGSDLTLVAKSSPKAEYTTVSGKFDADDSTAGGIEVDENTKFFQIKLKDDGVKVKSIVSLDYDSLDDTNFGDNCWIADIKYDKDNVAEYAGMVVFYDQKVERDVELNLAYVEDLDASSDEKTIYVITLDGKRENYTVDKDADVFADLKVGEDGIVDTIIDLKVVDGELVEIDTLDDEGTLTDDTLHVCSIDGNYVTKYNSKKTQIFFDEELITDKASLKIADDVLVLLEDDFGDLEVSSIGDLDACKNITDINVDEYDELLDVVVYTNDASDKDVEIVFIKYHVATND